MLAALVALPLGMAAQFLAQAAEVLARPALPLHAQEELAEQTVLEQTVILMEARVETARQVLAMLAAAAAAVLAQPETQALGLVELVEPQEALAALEAPAVPLRPVVAAAARTAA
jgi:hypothetical protein